MTGDASYRVCELARRGRLVTADPWFEAGVPLVLESKSARDIPDGHLALVRIPSQGRAQVVAEIGPAARIDSVLEGLLLEREAACPYEGDSPAELEARSIASDPTDHAGRVDLRALSTVTIDPETARDFDDAISVSPEEAGWRLWIHIADVSAYVRPGTAVDEWARARAFSTYVPGRVSPMLPESLSAGVCSLQPGVDRWSVTVEIALDGDVNVTQASFYRSVIHSDARLTYAEAERLVAATGDREPDAVISTVRAAATVSSALRGRRFAGGAMQLERPELVVELDDNGGVGTARWEAEPEAHALIEELMLIANETVARFLANADTDALYRVHPDPDPQAIVGLISRLAALDVPTPPEPEHLTPSGAARLAARIAGLVATHAAAQPRGAEAYGSLVLRSLDRARYEPSNRGHSGLASPAYCHFTSPIRRYPDLVCHRALLTQLGLDSVAPVADLADLAEHCSERERTLAAIEHDANDICLAWLLDRVLYDEGWEATFEADVIGVINSGLFLRFGDVFEGYLPARVLAGDYFELDELAIGLVGRRSGHRIRLGDTLVVRVDTLDRATGRVRLAP